MIKENNLKFLIESDKAVPLILMPYKEILLSLDSYSFGFSQSKLALHVPCVNNISK